MSATTASFDMRPRALHPPGHLLPPRSVVGLDQRGLEWLPPSSLALLSKETEAVQLAKHALLNEWLQEFEGGAGEFYSSAVFLEVQLRKALAATSSSSTPDTFRTAAVCECLARLPECAGPFSRILQILRAELLRSVYHDFDHVESTNSVVNAEVLFKSKTFFSKVEELRQFNEEMSDRFSALEKSRQALQTETAARAEMLRMALERWNSVMVLVKRDLRGSREAQDAVDRLSMLVSSMEEHCKTIDELARVATTDPAARLHVYFNSLGATHRTQMLQSLLQLHGANIIAAFGREERSKFISGLLDSVTLKDRQELIRDLVRDRSITGSTVPFLDYVVDGMDAEELTILLKQNANRCRRQMGGAEAADLAADLKQAMLSLSKTTSTSTQMPERKSLAQREGELATLAEKLGEQAVASLGSARKLLQESNLTPSMLANDEPEDSCEAWPLLVALERRCADFERELDLHQSSVAKLGEQLAMSESREAMLRAQMDDFVSRRMSSLDARIGDFDPGRCDSLRPSADNSNGELNSIRSYRSGNDPTSPGISRTRLVSFNDEAARNNARGRAITHQEAAVEDVLKRYSLRRSGHSWLKSTPDEDETDTWATQESVRPSRTETNAVQLPRVMI
ncbi:hypothetical protein AB1Y20_021385 [Prymnesium parvum]|uniref:Uncharacterized protein n=1 Tax=Prymnesium parvum TaxID=97485 RepID=A0AB34JI46_PRYPA